MTLENPQVLRQKNRRRLRDLINITFAVGINVTAPSKPKSYLRIIAIILIIASLIGVYGQIMYIYRYRHSILANAESICTIFEVLTSIFKLSYIAFVQHQFYKVLNLVKTHELVDRIDFLSKETPYNKDLRRDAVKILDQCWKFAKRQFNLYMAVICPVISYYVFGDIVMNAYHSMIKTPNYTNRLALPTIFPFWEDKMNEFPYNQILTVVTGLVSYAGGLGALSFDGMFIIFSLHGVALFQVLRKMIVFTTSPHVPKELRLDYLRQCINHYERTYQYCLDFNRLYLHASLIQFLLSLVTLGVVMFQAAFGLENDLTMFFRMALFISAAGCQVVVYCLNGQLVTNVSETIPFAWYECDWYNESKEFKKLINMMILRSNRTIDIRASFFTTMSLPTCLSIFQTSYSYFLLLRNLSEEHN